MMSSPESTNTFELKWHLPFLHSAGAAGAGVHCAAPGMTSCQQCTRENEFLSTKYRLEWFFINTSHSGISVQFSSVPCPIGSLGGHGDDSAEILLQSFLQEALVSSSGMGYHRHINSGTLF